MPDTSLCRVCTQDFLLLLLPDNILVRYVLDVHLPYGVQQDHLESKWAFKAICSGHSEPLALIKPPSGFVEMQKPLR